MTNTEMMKKIFEETEKAGGPKELVRQLSLNTTLENRKKELGDAIEARGRTIGRLDLTIQERLKADQKSQQQHEENIERIKKEHAKFVTNIKNEQYALTNERDGIRQEVEDAKKERDALGTAVASGRFFLSIVANDPELLRLHKQYMTHIIDPTQWEPPQLPDAVAFSIINAARDRFTRGGLLVPRDELEAAKKEAASAKQQSENDRFIRTWWVPAIQQFVRNPRKMSTEQKRVMLEAYAQSLGYTPERFRQLMKALESSERCMLHGSVMIFDYTLNKWRCTTPGCVCKR